MRGRYEQRRNAELIGKPGLRQRVLDGRDRNAEHQFLTGDSTALECFEDHFALAEPDRGTLAGRAEQTDAGTAMVEHPDRMAAQPVDIDRLSRKWRRHRRYNAKLSLSTHRAVIQLSRRPRRCLCRIDAYANMSVCTQQAC